MPRTPKTSSHAVIATGNSPAASPSTASGSLVATSASTRQFARSLSAPTARRQSVPVRWVVRVSGGMCASSRRLAWRRSISARRAQAATAKSTSGSPIQMAPSAAPSRSSAAVSAHSRPSGRLRTRYSSASTARAQPAAEVDRVGGGGHGPLPTRTSPVVESACTWNGASSPVETPRTLRLPSSLSASTR